MASRVERAVRLDSDEESAEESGEDMEHVPPQLRGKYTCMFCGLSYAQQRFVIYYGKDEDPVFFCLPECMAGWDWLIMGQEVVTDEQKQSRIAFYKKSFGRTVVPAPGYVYHTPGTDRMAWLEECRSILSPDERVIADNELQLVDNLQRAQSKTAATVPDDMAIHYATIEQQLPQEVAAEELPEDDFFDMGPLEEQMGNLVVHERDQVE